MEPQTPWRGILFQQPRLLLGGGGREDGEVGSETSADSGTLKWLVLCSRNKEAHVDLSLSAFRRGWRL